VSARIVAFAAVALLAGTAGYLTHRASTRAPVPTLSAPAPAPAPAPTASANPLATTFADLAGAQRALDSWPARFVVVNFWATWCPPCLKEIPAFMALQDTLGERGVQFIGVALDEAAAVAPFVAERKLNYPVLVGDDDVARFMQSLGNDLGALPYTVVLDDSGAVLHAHQGEWLAEDVTSTLERLLGAP